MTTRPLLLATLALCVPLAGCAGDYRGVETIHQPVVTQTDYALDLLAGPDGLAQGEAQRLRGWLDVLGAAPGATIAIDDPGAIPAVRNDIAAVAGGHGLRFAATTPAPGAALTPGTVRVVVTRSAASVPSCQVPGARSGIVNFDAHAGSTFGCAINGNLAAMVADPTDLIQGKSDDGSGTAMTAAKAVGMWRKAAPTGAGGTVLKSESTGGR
ncbi:CpaD family pilus assembly lipoprotein [Sphingomonas phyllosphaerae]|uniref:CpaD family pilus assembly lipoprotein n=1 Tax=Sphingomonas phyllosphaerae TaxID=257003 RepID=UPI0004258B49|nr:CpaD family pilus assembly lipoprotein [Sphingomonas phyllosphaerae]